MFPVYSSMFQDIALRVDLSYWLLPSFVSMDVSNPTSGSHSASKRFFFLIKQLTYTYYSFVNIKEFNHI